MGVKTNNQPLKGAVMKRMVLFTLMFAVVSLSLACGGGAISVLKKPSSAYLPATPFIGQSEDRNVFLECC